MQKSSPSVPLVEDELDVEGRGQARLDLLDLGIAEALGAQLRMVQGGRVLQRAMAHGITDDLLDLGLVIAQGAERLGHGLVDDLEVAAAGQLLEFYQREVGFDAGGIAVHDEADCAGGRDDRRLGIAIAMRFAQRDREVPGLARGRGQRLVLEAGIVEWNGCGADVLVAHGGAIGGAAMVAHHPQHVVAILREAGEGAKLLGHLGRGGIGHARHDGRDGAADGAALMAVIGNAGGHEQAADIGEAQAECAELVGQSGDFLRRELRHHHRDFQHDGPQTYGMLEARDVEGTGLDIAEAQQVQRSQVAGRIVEEHVFRAGVRRPDLARGRAGVPVVDGRMELDAGIGRGPGGIADLVPEFPCLEGLGHLAIEARGEVPVAIGLDGAQEFVGDAHRIVGVLAGNGAIGLAVPVGVVGIEGDLGIALARELDDALDEVVGHQCLAGVLDGALEGGILLDLVAVAAGTLAVHAGLHDSGQVLLDDLRAGDEGGDLLLFLHLPVDIVFDVRMIDVDHHHLGGAACGAAGLDGARRAVADLEETHQSGGAAAARELLVLAAQMGEVGAGARAILEQPGLAHPQIHDAALVDEVVGDGLNEAGMRLGMLVGRLGLGQLAGLEVDIVVALARAIDAIGPVQAGIEPLRAVGRALLRRPA